MPRLSLWKDGKHTNDYKFMDRRISEMFTVGGTGVLVHKYLGPINQGETNDETQPNYSTQSEQNIQDLLFVENRDRKYDSSVYRMRGIYQRGDQDFDLSQFGIFLQAGTLFMTFHANDMVETLGRRIVSGDVIELEHLKDFHALNDLPVALKRYYVVGDASFAAEGFTPTWWPHLWRVKLNPLVDSQEYKDILNTIKENINGVETPIGTILSTYDRYKDINEKIVAQAEIDVPSSGYNTVGLYTGTRDPNNLPGSVSGETADDIEITSDSTGVTSDSAPLNPENKPQGYLTQDGMAPNGLPVGAGIAFPSDPGTGDYFLRLDYLPNRLFRFDGRRWVKIEDAVRTSLSTGSNNKTLRSSFVNDSTNYVDSDGESHPTLQSLSKALSPRADN